MGLHTLPNPNGYNLSDILEEYVVGGRRVPYAADREYSRGYLPAASWLRANPHRLHLGQIGFSIIKSDGSLVGIEDLANISQTLDLWTGLLSSRFEIESEPVKVLTVCHPKSEPRTAGDYEVVWDARDDDDDVVPNGYYLAQLDIAVEVQNGEEVVIEHSYDVLYGLFCNIEGTFEFGVSTVTSSAGEFEIPFTEIPVGYRVFTTGAGGPDVLGQVRVPKVVKAVVRDGTRAAEKYIDFGDMTHWEYVEFTLPDQ